MLYPVRILVLVQIIGAASDRTVNITEAEVHEAQRQWGFSIVDIGKVKVQGGDFVAYAGRLVDDLYAFDVPDVDVLFKPTMAEEKPFRTTREGALSYFVAHAPADFPEDVAHGGFALHPWQAVRFEVAGNWYGPGSALSMGHYIFTDMNGTEHVVEFSMGYVRDGEDRVRIALHHSSFPFCGEEFVTSKPCNLNSENNLAGVWSSPSAAPHRRLASAIVTPDAVRDAEQTWGTGVVDLGKDSAAEVHSKAVEFVANSYAYGAEGPYIPPTPWTGPGCLFKPTKARVTPFRTTLDGAVSYFVGHDQNFAEDHGFALQPWTKVRFEAKGITQLSPSMTVTMGHYFFTDTDGKETRAEFSLAFVSADDGSSAPAIALHHSSFPFCSTCQPSRTAAVSAPTSLRGTVMV